MDVNLLNKKIELIQWLSALDDSTVIEKLLDFRRAEMKDWWGELSDEERGSVEQGIADADDQKLKPHSEARKLYEKWL